MPTLPVSTRTRPPLPMRSKAAITPQKRGLELPSQPHKYVFKRSELSQGPPKTAEVIVLQQRHLLSQQPAEKVRAFRQSFACPPDAPSLNLGGGRGSCTLARHVALLIQVPLQARHPKTPVGQHPRRNHTPSPATPRTKIPRHLHLLLALHLPVPLIAAMSLQPALPLAPRTVPRCLRSLLPLQTAFKNLHPSRYP